VGTTIADQSRWSVTPTRRSTAGKAGKKSDTTLVLGSTSRYSPLCPIGNCVEGCRRVRPVLPESHPEGNSWARCSLPENAFGQVAISQSETSRRGRRRVGPLQQFDPVRASPSSSRMALVTLVLPLLEARNSLMMTWEALGVQGVGQPAPSNVFGHWRQVGDPWSGAQTDLHPSPSSPAARTRTILALQPMTRLVAAVPLTKKSTRSTPRGLAEEHDNRTHCGPWCRRAGIAPPTSRIGCGRSDCGAKSVVIVRERKTADYSYA